jgi:heme exporter protein B
MTPLGPVAQAREVVRKDLRIEGRTGEVLLVTIPFGALALLLIPLAVGTNAPLLSQIGIGVYWVVVLLFGMLVTQRSAAIDPEECRDLLTLLAVDPAAVFLGRVAASSLLLVAFEAILAPVAIVLYAPPGVAGWPWLMVVGVLVAIGLALVGTLTAEITSGLRGRVTLAPLLVVPLAVPLLFVATQVAESLRLGRGIIPWVLLVCAMDVGLSVVGVLITGPLREPVRGKT